MKKRCPEILLTSVLQENVARIMAAAVAGLTDPDRQDGERPVASLESWLLPVCAVSPYIERTCLQFSELLPRLCRENALTENFLPLTPASLVSELEIDLQSRVDLAGIVADGKQRDALEQAVLRQFRHRHLVAILWRDLTGIATLEQTLAALSTLAQSCVMAADQWTYDALARRFGIPCDSAGREQRLIVLGMGKLGGYELNVSSDIDLIFIWPAAGDTRVDQSGQRSLDNGEFFRRSVQRINLLLNSVTQDGFVYRVDTRLRPFGESGPLVSNFEGLENYYVTQGRDWERYAMIKSRALCGNPEDVKTLESLITPFVYRRYLDYNAVESLRDLKKKIALSVVNKGNENNIKLGTGGIREIEFIGQSFQLVRGGRDKRLRIRSIIQVLELLAVQKLMPVQDVDSLLTAYRFLRKVENAIQMVRDEQKHNLPEDGLDQARLLAIVDEETWPVFLQKLSDHRARVANCFRQLFEDDPSESVTDETSGSQTVPGSDNGGNTQTTETINNLWLSLVSQETSDETKTELLKESGFNPDETLLSAVSNLVRESYFQRLTAESQRRIERIAPLIITLAAQSADPHSALTRSLAFVRAVAGRSGYLQVLTDQPAALARLMDLFARSSWLAAFVTSQPMVIDELLTGDDRSTARDANAVHAETQEFVSRLMSVGFEEQLNSFRHYRQAREMRLACAQLDGTLTLMQVSDQLTWLAESVIAGVIKLVEAELQQKHGAPCCIDNAQASARKTQLAIIGYGKLGGLELGFGSDLDLVFLHDSRGEQQMTDGGSPIDNARYYSRVAQKFVHFMNTVTPAGVLYEIDLRLRPNGSSGVLVTGIDSFSDYQCQEAWTWEHQALMRTRLVYGSEQMLERFDAIRQAVLAQPRSAEDLREAVANMRSRMREALGNKNPVRMNLKQDSGGVADIEFVVQFLVLAHAAQYPQLLQYTDNIRVLETAEESNLISRKDAHTLTECYLTLRERLHFQALQESSPVVDLDDQLTELRNRVEEIRSRILGDV